eukprot:8493668-Pyramimonas_sp.AAC.1
MTAGDACAIGRAALADAIVAEELVRARAEETKVVGEWRQRVDDALGRMDGDDGGAEGEGADEVKDILAALDGFIVQHETSDGTQYVSCVTRQGRTQCAINAYRVWLCEQAATVALMRAWRQGFVLKP